MPERERLRRDLTRLREELARSSSLDRADRDLLEELARDIETVLERREAHEPAPLGDRLREAMGRFEEDHPRLTAAVGRIADALAALGV